MSSLNINYCPNPSFDNGTDGWSPLNSSISVLSTGGAFGPNFLKVVKKAEAYSGIRTNRLTAVNTRGVSSNYTASAYVKIPSGDQNGTLFVSILWYTDGMSFISEVSSAGSAITNGGSWTRISLTNSQPPADAGYASVRVSQHAAGSAGESFYVDAVQLEVGSAATEFKGYIDQAEEKAILNKALSKVPVPHLTGAELNADIELNGLIFNTIDPDGITWVVTDIKGLHNQPESEIPEMSRGIFADGDYDTKGRYKARAITIEGSILVPDGTYVTEARDKLVRATNLVRTGAWLKLKSKNERVRAIYVRLLGGINISVVNPRGRMNFSIGLKAPDPIIYEWNVSRDDGYFVSNVVAMNFDGSQVGSIDIGNNGNYPVSAIFDVRGPVYGPNATIFNASNQDLITFSESLRGESRYNIATKELVEGLASLKFDREHQLYVGDEITVALSENVVVTGVSRTSGNAVATITTSETHGFSNLDSVVLTNVDTTLNGTVLTVANASGTSFTVTGTSTTALSNAALVSASALDYTNQRFNGTQYVSAVPNAKAIKYSTEYRESTALTNVSNQNVITTRNIVYLDADHLEIDTKNQEVALNGDAAEQRAKLDALIDWIKLGAGNNELSFDDSNQHVYYVTNRVRANTGVVTLTTAETHGFDVGDNIIVDYLGTGYDTANRVLVTSYQQSGTTLTLTTDAAHGFADGQTVVITGVSGTLDGKYVIAANTSTTINVTTNAASSANVNPTLVSGTAKTIRPVTYYSKSNNTVTIVAPSHGLVAGDPIYIANVHDEVDGQAWVQTNVNADVFTFDTRTIREASKIANTAASSGAQVIRRFPVTAITDQTLSYNSGNTTANTTGGVGLLASVNGTYAAITATSRTKNVATITTKTKHGFAAGDFIKVEGTDSAGTGYTVSYGDEKQISSYLVAGTKVTITAASNGLLANDAVTIYGINTNVDGVDINGTYSVDSVDTPNNKFTYTASPAKDVEYNTTARSLTSNVATVYLSTAPKFKATDDDGNPTRITITGLDSPFNVSNVALSTVDLNDNSITFSLTNANVAYGANTSGIVGLTYSGTPERAFEYKRNTILYHTINNGTGVDATVSGNVAWMITESAHTLNVGDTVEILNLSSVVNGTRTVASVPNTSAFTVLIDNSTIVQKKNFTIATRNAGVSSMKLTFSSAHGFYAGDYIYLKRSTTAVFTDGVYKITSRPDSKTLTVTTAGTSAINAAASTVTHFAYPVDAEAYAIRAYEILASPAPTDYTFSYKNSGANASASVSNVSGEVVRNSDATMKVFYRSGWIG